MCLPTHPLRRASGPRPDARRRALSAASGVPRRETIAAAMQGLAQQETSDRVSLGTEREGKLQRRAGVEARAEAAGDALAGRGRPAARATVAAQEAAPGRRWRGALARVGEGHVPGVGVVGIARQDLARVGASSWVTTWSAWPLFAWRTQDPLVVCDDAQAETRSGPRPGSAREIFTGSTSWMKTSSSWRIPCARCEKRVWPAEWRIRRPRRRAAHGPGSETRLRRLVVTGERLGRRVADGLVRERRQAVLAASRARCRRTRATTVPNIFGDHVLHRRGVCVSPSSATTYSRPSSPKPPRPLARASGGTSRPRRCAAVPRIGRPRGRHVGRFRLGPVGVRVLQLCRQVAPTPR